MFKEILVPVDRSTCADAALAHAAAIAQVFDARVTLLHVMEGARAPVPALADPIEWQISRVEADTYMQERASHLQAGGIDVSWHVVEGDPASRIVEFIRERRIDLVVLCAHGQSNATDWLLGSVTQKIVTLALTSLLIVRPSLPSERGGATNGGVTYCKIILPLDASQRAECVLPVAITLSQKHRAHVMLAHVIERPYMPRRTPLTAKEKKLSDSVMEMNRSEAERYLAGLQDRFAAQVSTRLITDQRAATALHQLAQQERCDLVILSAHGNTSNMAWPYGSLVASFIAYGSTNVLILQDRQ